jgi:hypothetical protein
MSDPPPTGARPRSIAAGCDDRQTVIFRQFIHDDLGCASYLLGDVHAGVCAVVDPRLEIDHVAGGGVPTWARAGYEVDSVSAASANA